jgi:5-oxopent-3-ene-1,2,5-tricarboxylate decarboxylase/2-hydroxyhepta-2,4-diene-1,7-dioate isomerase
MTEYRRILLDGTEIQVVRDGAELVAADGRRVAADEAVHLPPCAPTKIVAVHLNHRSRVEEFGARLPAAPTYFHKPVSALLGHGGAVVRPDGCQYLNYEGEVAIVIGRPCRGITPEQAGEYIAGYTIGNDFGLHDFRDTDAGSMLRVKGSDTMAPLGPGLVTGWDFRGGPGRLDRRDAVGHALPGGRHRPDDHPAAGRRAAVRDPGQLPAGQAR